MSSRPGRNIYIETLSKKTNKKQTRHPEEVGKMGAQNLVDPCEFCSSTVIDIPRTSTCFCYRMLVTFGWEVFPCLPVSFPGLEMPFSLRNRACSAATGHWLCSTQTTATPRGYEVGAIQSLTSPTPPFTWQVTDPTAALKPAFSF